MKPLVRATILLLPRWRATLLYWGAAFSLLLLIEHGLKPTGPKTAELWGLPLIRFGFSAPEIMRNVYLEMTFHVWTVISLPYACLVALGPTMRTFRSDFLQFLRFSHQSRLFVESARIGAVLISVLFLVAPFVAGGLLALLQTWFDSSGFLHSTLGCAGLMIFICILVYFLTALGMPAEIASAIGLIAPFLLTGVSTVLSRPSLQVLEDVLPVGLPYSINSYRDPGLRAAVVYAGIGIMLRLLVSARTNWIDGDSP